MCRFVSGVCVKMCMRVCESVRACIHMRDDKLIYLFRPFSDAEKDQIDDLAHAEHDLPGERGWGVSGCVCVSVVGE